MLLVGNMAFLATVWVMLHRVHTESVDAQSDIRTLRQELEARTAQLTSVPWAYAETPDGVRIVPANQGVALADLGFLARYRGALLPAGADPATMKAGELISRLGTELQAGFGRDSANLRNGATPRQALAAFAVLRTRGSIATYEIRDAIPDHINELVLGVRGSCSDYALRLMMVLESLGFKAAMISSKSRNLDGHVFVDAYDPVEDTAYLLDANFSVMIVSPHSKGRNFMEALLALPKADREAFARSVEIHAFPDYFRFVDPGPLGLTQTPATAAYINEQLPGREAMWRRWLAQDTEQVLAWWRQVPSQAPRTLKELGAQYLHAIPAEFAVSGSAGARLREAAGRSVAPGQPASKAG